MIEFTLVKGKIVLDPNIVLFDELYDLYNLKPIGEKLLQVVYYRHSQSMQNPFRDVSRLEVDKNIMQMVFKKNKIEDLKLSPTARVKLEQAEKIFIKYNITAEGRMYNSLNKKLDEISDLLDNTLPEITSAVIPNTGETKYNSNLNIILGYFSKMDVILKSKSSLKAAMKNSNIVGRVTADRKMSLREKGLI